MSEVKRYDPSEDAYGNSKGMKWSPYGDYVLAEDYDALRAENIGMVAQRMAYAGEFPPDQDGLPDTGSIHQNIRKLRAENAELVAALVAVKNCIYRSDMVYSIAKKALAKHRCATQPTDKP